MGKVTLILTTILAALAVAAFVNINTKTETESLRFEHPFAVANCT